MANSQSKLLNKNADKAKWSKPNLLSLRGFNKEPGYRYRLVKTSESHTFIDGKDARGWEIVRKGAGAQDLQDTFTGNISQFGKEALGSIVKVGDLILARMPEDMAVQRNEYYANRTRLQSNKTPKQRVNSSLQGHMLEEEDIEKNLKPVRGQVLDY